MMQTSCLGYIHCNLIWMDMYASLVYVLDMLLLKSLCSNCISYWAFIGYIYSLPISK